MRYIDLYRIEPSSPKIQQWSVKAKRAFEELSKITSHKERADYLSDHSLWREFKDILVEEFGAICWYSGSDLANCQNGDVDHFRPKNCSKDINGQTILDNGYWWLAYDYYNYRLSCPTCNRSWKGGGKVDYFPIKSGTLPLHPDLPVESEENVLIDPCCRTDTELIGYNEQGKVIALTSDPWEKQRVWYSEKIYNLSKFNVERKSVYQRCQLACMFFELAYNTPNATPKLIDAITSLKQLVDDKAPYSSVAKLYILIELEGKEYRDQLANYLQLDVIPVG